MRRGLIAVAVMSLVLVAAASALASRAPRPGERAAITRAAKRAPHAGHSRVHVRHIRVSTVGPWATATVTIFIGRHAADSALAILRKRHGRWRIKGLGTADVSCRIGMPRRDQRNLGVLCKR